jgi:FixJ family two-component response regulator
MRAAVQKRIETLSPREREVLRILLVRGHNKSVASELGISVRTVEIHRSRVLSKMNAEGLPDLLRIMLSAGASV